MNFQALELSFSVVSSLRGSVRALRRLDRDLASQLSRALNSVALNLAEGSRREGKDRLHLYRIAAGSADEVRVALRLAEAWGYLDCNSLKQPLGSLDKIQAILWTVTH